MENRERSSSPDHSRVSLKSDASMKYPPPDLSDDPVTSDPSVDHGEEYDIKEGLHKYSHQLTLDLNTMNKLLRLSNGDSVISNTDTDHQYPDHADRFDVSQVLCRESVSGRCYWELQWSGDVSISVSYKSISRKGDGDECVFGANDQSWSLICSPSSYSFRHNNIVTDLPVKPIKEYDYADFRETGVSEEGAHYIRSTGVYDGDYDGDDDFSVIAVFDDEDIRRIGVFVDHDAGTLSFYRVSDTSLIHTLQTTFTQPLYPGFNVGYHSSVKLCE